MADPTDPPRKSRRAKRPEPDFVIDPSKPNATIELETADLLQLGQSGQVEPRANKTRPLQLSDLEELREGMPIQDPKVVVDLGPDPDAPPREPNVFVELDPAPAPAPVRASPRAPSPAVAASAPARAVSPAAAASASAPARAPAIAAPAPTPSPVDSPSPEPARAVAPAPPHVQVPSPAPSAPRPQAPAPTAAHLHVPAPAVGAPSPVHTPSPATAGHVARAASSRAQSPHPGELTPPTSARSSSQLPIPRQGGMGLVVVVYLVAAAALAASIYLRWFAA